jgi:diaminopimelate epimerase
MLMRLRKNMAIEFLEKNNYKEMNGIYNFSKMHGAGNDFIVINETSETCIKDIDFIKNICHRERGIGADGVIFLSALSNCSDDVVMKFYNSDGCIADMCGNGLRCVALFAKLHLVDQINISVITDVGVLQTKVLHNSNIEIEIPIIEPIKSMRVDNIDCYFVNSGVPHVVFFLDDINDFDVAKMGRYYRNHPLFKPNGVNVNFVTIQDDKNAPLLIRTYERGVEAETAACGTGIAAAAIAFAKKCNKKQEICFITRYNDLLSVEFITNDNMLEDMKKVLLRGPAIEVYKGQFDTKDFIGVMR